MFEDYINYNNIFITKSLLIFYNYITFENNIIIEKNN